MSLVIVNSRFLTQKLTGVQRFAFEISLRLKDLLGEEVVFLAPKSIIQHEMAERLGVKCIGRVSGYAWEQIVLPLYLWRHGSPRLLNLCSVAPLLYGNNIIAIHDITWVRYPDTFSKAFCMVYNFLTPRLCRKAKQIITVSDFSREEISTYYRIPREKILVVYNAVGDEFYHISDEKLKKQRYFLAVSSLKVNKNFFAVLKAFESVLQQEPHAKLFIVGDYNVKNFHKINIERYKNNPAIKFLGRVSDDKLVKYYSNAIGFVFPSLYEGFGIPVLEAQACGCPVISSSTASMPEVLRDSALFCDAMDIYNLAEQMCRLIRDDALRLLLINKGYNNIKRFSWRISAEKLWFILNRYNTDS